MVEFTLRYEKQDWSGALRALGPVFDSIRPDPTWASRGTVHNTVRKTLDRLDKDLETLNGEAGFIFSPGTEAGSLTAKTVDMLRRWHIAENAPSLASLAIFALQNMKLKLTPDIARGVLVGSVLGEVENNLPYHNNMHYKKVLLQVIRLVAVHNDIYADTAQAFDERQIAMLILAACIHDLGHDGKGNTMKGVFEPGRLERRAFELAQPYLESCGMNEKDLDTIRIMLLTTDVSPIGDPANPVNQMKAAFRYHFHSQKRKFESLNLDPEFSALESDADLTMMCLILHEADIGTSAGLDYKITTFETGLYKAEMNAKDATPQDVVAFLEDICFRQMNSDAAQRLYAANLARIFALAEKDAADGNQPYPQPQYSEFLLLHRSGKDGESKTIN